MAKEIKFDMAARDQLKSGIDQLANAVKITLGPKGRNVIIEKSIDNLILNFTCLTPKFSGPISPATTGTL